MTHSLKRSVSKSLLKALGLSKYFLKAYPIAIENQFQDISREQIDKLRQLFTLNVSNNITWKRFGSPGDGGYLLKDEISKSDICISLGVGDNYTFDLDIAKYCQQVLMFDHTIDHPQLLSSNMSFKKIGIASVEVEKFTTIERIISELPVESDLILKIDIEGAEWEILESITCDTLKRFKQIAAEFHNLHAIHDTEHFERIMNALSKISQTHFLANFHINNWASYQLVAGVPFPDVVEVTYIRRASSSGKQVNLENSLNQPNNIDLSNAASGFITVIEILPSMN
jgi:hypothetical protein